MPTLCHLSRLVETQAQRFGSRTAFLYRQKGEQGQWVGVSWQEFDQIVGRVSRALLSLGIKRQENIAVFSQNRKECFFSDFGAYGVGAVTIPFYATSSREQAQYMIDDAQIRLVMVGGQQQYDAVWPLREKCSSLEKIIIFDPEVRKDASDEESLYFDELLKRGDKEELNAEVEKRKQAAQFTDICNILYTSGTTGQSKGVILTYQMYRHAIANNIEELPITRDDIFLNFLPFTHVFERGCSYLGLSLGALQAINENPTDALRSMQEIRPTAMCAVPRFWEKIYEGVLEEVRKGGALRMAIFRRALSIGSRAVAYDSKQQPLPFGLRLQYKLFDRAVFRIIRKRIGLDRTNFFPTAGATISPEIETFVRAIGINFVAGYGLTESMATVSADLRDKPYTIGSVGRVIKGVELRISESGEILLRGKSITPGYYKRPKETSEAIDAEGWFHTGDAGYLKDGELFLTDRIKDLLKTSNGKYIAPQQIEAQLSADAWIDQIVVLADKLKFVSALIVPNYELIEEYAKQNGMSFANRAELCQSETINQIFQERIDALQQSLAKYEQVKRFRLLPSPFTLSSGELTNTLKIRRPLVAQNYREIIEEMYR